MGSSRESVSMSEALRMREEGFNEGLTKGRQEIVDWLEHAYLRDPDRPARMTPRAEAILDLAKAAHQHFSPQAVKRAVKRSSDRKPKKSTREIRKY